MIPILKKLFSSAPAIDYKTLMQNGAVILDVRTPDEYNRGHIKGSINIPVQSLQAQNVAALKKDTPIITCCASGMRSASAKSILTSMGFKQVYNGGSWAGLENKLN